MVILSPAFAPILFLPTAAVALISDVAAFVVRPQQLNIRAHSALSMWYRVDDEPPIDIDSSKFKTPEATTLGGTVEQAVQEFPRASDFETATPEDVLPTTTAEEEEPIDWSKFRPGPGPGPPPSSEAEDTAAAHLPTHPSAAPPPERRIFSRLLPMKANVHDVWWEYGRTWVAQPGGRSPRPQEWEEAPDALPLNEESVAQVLQEFVESDFAVTMCDYFNVDPTDCREVRGVFEYVHLDFLPEGMIILRLKSAFEEKKKSLLERLSQYLRARIPEVREVHSIHRDGRDIYI